MKFQHIDLFSGIGGFAYGLESTGHFETIAFCEIEDYARQILKRRFPGIPVFKDVRKLYRLATDCIPCPDCDEPFCELCGLHFFECDCVGCSEFDDEIGGCDVLTAGFPCQDVSVGHTWREATGLAGERSGLWSEAVRLTDALRPQFCIFENVAALRVRGLTQCLQDLWAVGYDAEWHIIPASSVGAIHQRERIWIIAYPQGIGMEGLWPEGVKKPQSLDKGLLSIRDSNGKWKVEPDICRNNDGLSARVDRLKAVGNAIVPHIAAMIGEAIVEHARPNQIPRGQVRVAAATPVHPDQKNKMGDMVGKTV